jgi:hypothetical protein
MGAPAIFVLLLTSAIAHGASVTRGFIEGPVREKNDRIIGCWNDAIARNEKLRKARVVMKYRIEKDGTVSSATATENTSKDAALGDCITRVFLDLRYPPDQPEPINVTFPVDLARSD